jgi:hypothetical protein
MEEMAYSEWSERMDIAGTNHWLPAYGFQQPTQLQQALLQHQDSNGTFSHLTLMQLRSRMTLPAVVA